MCRAPVLATLVVLANRWDVASTPLHTSPPGPVSQLVTHLSRARLLRTSRVRCSQKLTAPTHPCLVHEHHPPVVERNQPWSAKPTSATRPVRSLRPIFLSAVPQALNRSADCRLTHPNPTDCRKKLASLLVGGPWPNFEVFIKQPHSSLVQLRMLTEPPFWGRRAALVESLDVTLDRGAVEAEPAGGLAFGATPSDGLHYLGAPVYE
jgi:hypothetical protein